MIVENTFSMILSTLALIVAPSVFVGQEAGPLVCWGSNAYGVLDAPDGLFTAVAAGKEHSLAIRLDGSVLCWGNNDEGQCNAPSGSLLRWPEAVPTPSPDDPMAVLRVGARTPMANAMLRV